MRGKHLDSRGGQIRTGDLLLPKQARYRATLRPESMNLVGVGRLRQRSGVFSGKHLEQRPEGAATMADPLLVLVRRLAEGLLQLLRHEVRVVTESAEAARLRDYHACGGPGSHDCTVAIDVGRGTDERR